MLDLVTIGETMVAFMPDEKELIRYARSFGKKSAGAESNVAIGLAKLGLKSGWISKVGKDEFGEFILRELRGEGVDTSRVIQTAENPTGIMFKQFGFNSETSVFYYRKDSAASTLAISDLDEDYIRQAKIIHLSGVTPALSESCRATIDFLVEFARKNQITISFDPNIRLKLWSEEKAVACLYNILAKSHIVLMNISEAKILLGTDDVDVIIKKLRAFGAEKIAIKLGSKGAVVADREKIYPCPQVDTVVVDNIGAGDAFNSGFLCGVIEGQDTEMCGKMGAMMGALAVASYGDVEGLPNREQLENYLNHTHQIYR